MSRLSAFPPGPCLRVRFWGLSPRRTGIPACGYSYSSVTALVSDVVATALVTV